MTQAMKYTIYGADKAIGLSPRFGVCVFLRFFALFSAIIP